MRFDTSKKRSSRRSTAVGDSQNATRRCERRRAPWLLQGPERRRIVRRILEGIGHE